MFPFIFEWVWDIDHLVFMGGLWYALTIIGLGLTYCVAKTIIDIKSQEGKGGHDTHH